MKSNNNDNIKNDFLFFQNEVLKDIKNLETKMNEKIVQMNNLLEEQNSKIGNKIIEINSRFDILSNQIREKKNSENPEIFLQPFKKNIEESISKLDIKLNLAIKDFDNACFKYDKIISNNLSVPGLIGSSCPYDNLRPFLEFVNLKISELIKAKEKQTFDSKKYKEKLETIINNNKTQFETAQKKINEYCKKGFAQCDTNCADRMNIIEKRIEGLRIENGQFSYELKQRSEEIKVEWEKLDNIEKNLNSRYNEELEKYNNIIDKIGNKVDKYKNEFNLIKMRFTELSEFIKDIRFRRNININSYNSYKERKQYKEMSSKIDFTKKQKLKDEEKDEKENIEKENDILIDPDLKEEEEEILINHENNNYKNNNNENINFSNNKNENNVFNKEESNKERIEDINNEINRNNTETIKSAKISLKNTNLDFNNRKEVIDNKTNDLKIYKRITKNNNRYKTPNYKLNSNFNKSLNIMNINFEPEIKEKNNINKISSKNPQNFPNDKSKISEINVFKKVDNIKKMHEKELTNKKDDNYKNNFNPIEQNIKKKFEASSKRENNEQVKKIPLNFKELSKINNLILNANFQKIPNNTKENLSESYILMKKKIEEMQKIKILYGGKHSFQYHQLTAPLSLRKDIKNFGNDNFILNQFNGFSNNDLQKGNIEDLYYSQIKNDKSNTMLMNTSSLLRSSSQDIINFNNTPDRRMLPKIYNNNKKINHSNEKRNMQKSYSNKNFNFNNNFN